VCAEPPTRLPADLLSGYLARIRATRPRRLVFETAQVTFMDAASARLIAGTGRWLPAGVKPVISHPSPIVRRVLHVSGMGALCEFYFNAQ
jgi:anti-anti-sigma factor